MNKAKYNIPEKILDIVKSLSDAGFEAFLVGGCVRDLLLKDPPAGGPKDWDITTNATPEQIQKIFPDSIYENKFGTVGVKVRKLKVESRKLENTEKEKGILELEHSKLNENLKLKIENWSEATEIVEVTPYRLESKYSDKRHPDEVRFTGKLEDDLKRRDFTINAMALGLSTKHEARSTKQIQKSKSLKFKNSDLDIVSNFGFRISDFSLVDLFDGQKDLKNKIIRAVGDPEERFGEDALRMLRAVRFATELSAESGPDRNWQIEKQTAEAIKKQSHLLKMIAAERIKDEFVKIIMSKKPSVGIELMHDLGILKYVTPELEDGLGIDQNKAHKFAVWEHALKSMDHGASREWPLEIRLGALLHDIGKPKSRRWNKDKKDWTFYGHDVIGARMTIKILSRLKFPKRTIELITKFVRYHLFFSDTEKITLSAVRRIVRNVGPEHVWDLMKVRFCDRIGMGRPKETPYRLRKYESMIEEAMRAPITVGMLKINGARIMEITKEKPGPKIGFILHALLEEVLDNPKLNTEEHLEKRTIEFAKLSAQELEKIGKGGRAKKEKLEQKEVEAIRKKWWVK